MMREGWARKCHSTGNKRQTQKLAFHATPPNAKPTFPRTELPRSDGAQVTTVGFSRQALRLVVKAFSLKPDEGLTGRGYSRRLKRTVTPMRRAQVPKTSGAVEWIRTTTVLLPPAPQAGASASSATTA